MGKALVTGGCGFIGSKLAANLAENGYEVRVTDLSEADRSPLSGQNVEFIAADMTKPESLEGVAEDVDIVYHTAALFDYSTVVEEEVYMEVNVRGTENLLEAISGEGVERFVNWSTSGVYEPADTGGGDEAKNEDRRITENHPKNPGSRYDRSKWKQEKLVHEHAEDEGFDAVTLRPAPVYGPGNRYGVAQLVEAVAEGWLRIYPDTAEFRIPLVHVEDMVGAAIHLGEYGESGEAYNVVDDQKYTAERVLRFIGRLTGTRMYPAPVPAGIYDRIPEFKPVVSALERALDTVGRSPPVGADVLTYLRGNYWLSNQKLRATGYDLKHPDFRAGMQETVYWYVREGLIPGSVDSDGVKITLE
ncbi:MAG: NAD-dependent epimerase/dehydratase family protein [Halobacteria archaeon]